MRRTEKRQERGAEDLTEELCGVSVACSFFIVGESLIDDLAHSSIQAF